MLKKFVCTFWCIQTEHIFVCLFQQTLIRPRKDQSVGICCYIRLLTVFGNCVNWQLPRYALVSCIHYAAFDSWKCGSQLLIILYTSFVFSLFCCSHHCYLVMHNIRCKSLCQTEINQFLSNWIVLFGLFNDWCGPRLITPKQYT